MAISIKSLKPLEFGDAAATSRIVFPSEPSKLPLPVIAPDLCPQWYCDRHAETFGQLPTLGIHRVKDCLITRNGLVFNADGDLIFSRDTVSPFLFNQLDELFFQKVKSLEVVEAGRDALYIKIANPGAKVYGHWLLDILPALWVFRYSFDVISNDRPLKFILQNNAPGWAREMLKVLFGVVESDLVFYDEARQLVFARDLIIPSYLRVSAIVSPRYNDFVNDVAYSADLNYSEATRRNDLPKRFFIHRDRQGTNRKTVLDGAAPRRRPSGALRRM